MKELCGGRTGMAITATGYPALQTCTKAAFCHRIGDCIYMSVEILYEWRPYVLYLHAEISGGLNCVYVCIVNRQNLLTQCDRWEIPGLIVYCVLCMPAFCHTVHAWNDSWAHKALCICCAHVGHEWEPQHELDGAMRDCLLDPVWISLNSYVVVSGFQILNFRPVCNFFCAVLIPQALQRAWLHVCPTAYLKTLQWLGYRYWVKAVP